MKKRLRHTLVFTLLREPFRLYFKLVYRFSGKKFKPGKDVKGPYLILSNHALALDPLMLSLSFREPIFFVASDMIFSIPIWSKVIRYLVNPIPKTKYRSDLETIRDIVKIVKSGGSVGIFPEGNATFSGETMAIQPSIAKLIRLLKIPVVFYQIDGGYFVKPRWSRSVRKGKPVGYAKTIWTPDQVQSMSLDETYQGVLEQLSVNQYALQTHHPIKYKGHHLAEDIESAYFVCPQCGSFHTLISKNDRVTCTNCIFDVTYEPTGWLSANHDGKHYPDTITWYHAQLDSLKAYLDDPSLSSDTLIFKDDDETILRVYRGVSKDLLGKAMLSLTKKEVIITFEDGHEERWPMAFIKASVQQKNKLILYHTKEDKTYYAINHPKRNALKYVLAIDHLKEGEE